MANNFDAQYRLTLSENQIRVVFTALEWFFRNQLGQFSDMTEEIAKCGFIEDKGNPDNSKEFNAYVDRKHNADELFQQAYSAATAGKGVQPQTQDMLIAQDIWSVIRHKLWVEHLEPKSHDCNEAYPPFSISREELPQISRVR
jgi:hypothetical protein